MKKVSTIFASSTMLLLGALSLASCGDKLPSSSYEKVQFAFNGVEKSLKSIKLNSNDINSNESNIKLMAAKVNADDFSAIENLYVESDSQGDVIDELEYNQPPMIQFQYLKAILDDAGSDFEFGTKYYSNINNSIYYDIETGKKKASTETDYKWDYDFKLALEINIDNNDLITCDVSFDVKITKGNQEYNMVWYVGMELDYDMNNENPNYKLNMMTDDKNIMGNCTLENDYVEVLDSKITEWRKFVLESDRKVVKDSSHPNFDSYINEGIDYTIGHPKWYKNSNLRKLMNNKGENKKIVANALFNAGLNVTDINGAAFQDKNGTVNDKIQKFYNEFSRINGSDILYSLLPDDDKDPEKDKTRSAGIIVMLDENTAFQTGNYIVKDVTMNELFTDTEAWKNQTQDTYILPMIYFTNADGEILDRITDLTPFRYYIIKGNEETLVSNGSMISNIYQQFGNPERVDIKLVHGDFSTIIKDVKIDVKTTDTGDNSDLYKKELNDLGYPYLDGDYEITKEGNVYFVDNLNFGKYRDTLIQNGFIVMNSDGLTLGYESSESLLRVRNYDNDKTEFRIDDNPFTDWDTNYVNTVFDGVARIGEPKGSNVKFVFDKTNSSISIYGLTEYERTNYINSLKLINNNSVIVGGDNGIHEVLRIVDESQNKYYEILIGEEDYSIVRISCNYNTYNMKKVFYSINGGTNKEFNYIDYGEFNEYDSSYYLFHYDYVILNENDTLTFTGSGFNISQINLVNANSYGTFNGNTLTIIGSYRYIYAIKFYDDYTIGETEVSAYILSMSSVDSNTLNIITSGPTWTNDDITTITNTLNDYFKTIEIDQNTSITIDNAVTVNSSSSSAINCTILSAGKYGTKEIGNRICELLAERGYPVHIG